MQLKGCHNGDENTALLVSVNWKGAGGVSQVTRENRSIEFEISEDLYRSNLTL
jgi:hypothetical protein